MFINSSKKKKYTFTRSEKRGIFVFLFLVLIFLFFRYFCLLHISPEKAVVYDDFEQQISDIRKDKWAKKSDQNKSQSALNELPKKKDSLFMFNPNSVTYEELLLLGFSEKQARQIENYRIKGGEFKKKEDLKKIYSVSENVFDRVSPYIVILNRDNIKQEVTIPKSIDLNKADSLKLIEIYGIGPVFATRIISYRNKLGGYYSLEQLREVKGIEDELIERISRYMHVDSSQIEKININTATLEELKAHPYLNYYQAKAIVQYRDQVNRFSDIEELKNVNLIYDLTYNKIKPYIVDH